MHYYLGVPLEDGSGGDNLAERDPEEELAEGALLNGSIMKLGELVSAEGLNGSGECEQVLGNGASGGEHSKAAILQLSLAQPPAVKAVRNT